MKKLFYIDGKMFSGHINRDGKPADLRPVIMRNVINRFEGEEENEPKGDIWFEFNKGHAREGVEGWSPYSYDYAFYLKEEVVLPLEPEATRYRVLCQNRRILALDENGKPTQFRLPDLTFNGHWTEEEKARQEAESSKRNQEWHKKMDAAKERLKNNLDDMIKKIMLSLQSNEKKMLKRELFHGRNNDSLRNFVFRKICEELGIDHYYVYLLDAYREEIRALVKSVLTKP